MSTTLVRVSPRTHKLLKELAQAEGESLPAVLDKAVTHYRRQVFLQGLASDFAALKARPAKWVREQKERQAWDAVLADGLEDDR